jgi:DNA polymerase-3 subunit delta'
VTEGRGDAAPALFVDADGRLPLPWLADTLTQALAQPRGHAWLLHAAAGQGALALALVLAQSRLCEARPAGAPPALACGRCPACHLVRQHAHPDLFVLLPETLRRELSWPLPDDKTEGEAARAKPSRQIRVDEMRWLIDRLQRTSGRGRGKLAVLHPAQALNDVAANALLKTLEEPPEGTTLILTASDPSRLLPTVRSRCQIRRVPPPAGSAVLPWLESQGVSRPQILLAAAGGMPLDALALHREGVDAATWEALPKAVAAGQGAALGTLARWGAARSIQAMLALAHDALAVTLGGSPRYFPPASMPAPGDPSALERWIDELTRVARHAEHPWNEPLLFDTLLGQARQALAPRGALGSGGRGGPARAGSAATLRP